METLNIGDTIKHIRTGKKDFVYLINFFNKFLETSNPKMFVLPITNYVPGGLSRSCEVENYVRCRMVLTEKTLKVWK